MPTEKGVQCLPVVPLVKQMMARSSGFGGFDVEQKIKTLSLLTHCQGTLGENVTHTNVTQMFAKRFIVTYNRLLEIVFAQFL